MQIRLGLALDAERSWAHQDHLGAPTLGPLGFVSLLEAQLGLTRNWPSHAERVMQFRECLKALDSAQRFYHRSFSIDEPGTSATLLHWRDLWHLHGWSGVLSATAPARLCDMADVERLTHGVLAPSVGERLQAIIDVLARRRPPISEIVLLDPIASFPARWRRVLSYFCVRQAAPLSKPLGKGFLGDLQRALIAVQQGEVVAPVPFREDGTVAIWRAETRMLASRWMAERLRQQGEEETLLVADAHGALLDQTLVASGLPLHGLCKSSELQPGLQLLALAIRLLWEPLDFHSVLAFLTHSLCPLPRYARWMLAEKLADRPGLGGERWAGLGKVDLHYGKKAAEVRAAIARWLEHERYDPNSGVPVAVVVTRTHALCAFLRTRLHDDDPVIAQAHAAGLAQATAFATVLERLSQQGIASLLRHAIDQLVMQVTHARSSTASLECEVGCASWASRPAAVIEAFDTVLWWQMVEPGIHHTYPWSRQEMHALAEHGVALPGEEQALAQALETWTRPIRAARERVELILPPQTEAVHPVWLMLKSVVTAPRVVDLEQVLLGKSEATLQPIAHRPLPPRRRWWQLSAEIAIPRSKSDSYTSLALLLNTPHRWVLKYAVGLQRSPLLAISEGNLLYGKLAHRIVEHAYRDSYALKVDQAAFDAWLDGALAAIVREEGAVLLLPEHKADLARFGYLLRRALKELRRQLAFAGVVDAMPEMKLTGSYPGGLLAGPADLVVRNVHGRSAILDVKWGRAKDHLSTLSENGHLQLAIYAELFRQQAGSFPEVAYFVVDSARLLARINEFFTGANPVRNASEEPTAHVWQRFLVSHTWRMDQITAGRVEVAAADIEPTAESIPPENGFAVAEPGRWSDDFDNLLGWEAAS